MDKPVSKKKYYRKKPLGHYEGKYWCDCLVRKHRQWLGRKLNGKESDTELWMGVVV